MVPTALDREKHSIAEDYRAENVPPPRTPITKTGGSRDPGKRGKAVGFV